MIKEFDGKSKYAFDAAKYVEYAKNVALTIGDVEFKVLLLGDGAIVEPVTPTIGLCKGLAVLPGCCREIKDV